MSTTTTRMNVRLKHVLAMVMTTLVLSLVMSSCGGGVGSGGTGSPATSFSDGSFGSGTVTGFGSLVVDGITYDDTQIPVMTEAQPNVLMPATAKLGQFTELEFDATSTDQDAIRTIRIEAAVVGRIDAVDAARHVLNVLGQTVVENTSADVGPVTFYSGVAGLFALRAGDGVEVHGVPRWNELSARYEVLAARIEKLPSVPPVRRLAGVVQNESAGGIGRTIQLGGLQVTYRPSSTLPAGSAPRNGDRVVVWSDQSVSTGSLEASAVRVVARNLPAPGKDSRLGGTVTRLDNSSQRFDLAGVEVRYDNANVTPNGKDFSLGNGVYVVVDGAYAADGALEAKHVKIRKRGAPDYVEVELTGPIESFIDARSFIVRGTPVDASGALPLRGCGNASLREGLNVRIEGGVQAGATGSVVKAETVRCIN